MIKYILIYSLVATVSHMALAELDAPVTECNPGSHLVNGDCALDDYTPEQITPNTLTQEQIDAGKADQEVNGPEKSATKKQSPRDAAEVCTNIKTKEVVYARVNPSGYTACKEINSCVSKYGACYNGWRQSQWCISNYLKNETLCESAAKKCYSGCETLKGITLCSKYRITEDEATRSTSFFQGCAVAQTSKYIEEGVDKAKNYLQGLFGGAEEDSGEIVTAGAGPGQRFNNGGQPITFPDNPPVPEPRPVSSDGSGGGGGGSSDGSGGSADGSTPQPSQSYSNNNYSNGEQQTADNNSNNNTNNYGGGGYSPASLPSTSQQYQQPVSNDNLGASNKNNTDNNEGVGGGNRGEGVSAVARGTNVSGDEFIAGRGRRGNSNFNNNGDNAVYDGNGNTIQAASVNNSGLPGIGSPTLVASADVNTNANSGDTHFPGMDSQGRFHNRKGATSAASIMQNGTEAQKKELLNSLRLKQKMGTLSKAELAILKEIQKRVNAKNSSKRGRYLSSFDTAAAEKSQYDEYRRMRVGWGTQSVITIEPANFFPLDYNGDINTGGELQPVGGQQWVDCEAAHLCKIQDI